MRSKEFIKEAKGKKIVLLNKKIINQIHSECGDFLSNAKSPLFRGFKREIKGLQKVPIRTNRVPADSSSIDTAAFNYLFELNTGVPYIRNITAFATTEAHVADQYGRIHMIFPLNGTKYYRATGIVDVYGEFESNIGDFEDTASDYIRAIVKSDDEEDRLIAELEDIQDNVYATKGRVNKAGLHKIFGKHIKLWKMFIKQFQPIINKFYMYDGFHPELNKANEEIGMFGVPFYYVFNIENIIDMASDLDYKIYINDKRIDTNGGDMDDMELFVLHAIKNNHEIYAIKREWD